MFEIFVIELFVRSISNNILLGTGYVNFRGKANHIMEVAEACIKINGWHDSLKEARYKTNSHTV